MMKWLRKHSKRIMVALVLVAMFSFVGGSALVNILSPKNVNPVAFRAFGRDIRNKQVYTAQRDITLYEAMGIPWKMSSHELGAHHWYMLVHEAENAGVVVTDAEVDRVVDSFSQQSSLGPQWPEVLRRQRGLVLPEIKAGIRDFLAVNKNINRLFGAVAPSEPELRHYVRDTEAKVSVRFVPLDAQSFVDPARPVTNEEAQAQFEKYKDVDPGTGEAGWGYRLPNRVKVQYIMADLSKIQPLIPLTIEEITAYWRANRTRYQTTDYVDETPTTSEPATSQAASQPTKKKIQREKTFSEARADVERELRTQKAAKLAEQAMRKVRDALLKPWFEMKTDPQTGFKSIPSEVTAPGYMQNICDSVSKEAGIPLEVKETPLLSQEKLASWPDLRDAKMAGKGTDRLSLSEYAFNVPLFLEKKLSRETIHSLQLYQPPDAPLTEEGMGTVQYDPSTGKYGLVEGSTERFVIFRVVEAQSAGVATSLDEVREEVERDVRLQRAFDEIKPIAEELCAVSERLGVEQALSLFKDLRTTRGVREAISPPPFARLEDQVRREDKANRRERSQKALELLLAGKPVLVPPDVRGVGSSAEFVDACFEMARPGWKAPHCQAPATTQMAEAAMRPAAVPEPVVSVLPLQKLHKWFVIQLLNVQPVDQNAYETRLKQGGYEALVSERARVMKSNWLKPENIENRCRYERRAEELGRTSEGIQPGMPAPEQAPDFGY